MGVGAAALAYKFGECEEDGCENPAIYRCELKVCAAHKPANTVFAPFLGQQEKFFRARQRFVLYGGAAGGGKTLCGMVKFGQQLAIEHARFVEAKREGRKFRSVAWGGYLRRTSPNFMQAIERSRPFFEAMDPAAEFNQNKGLWVFPSCGGAVFQFATMEHEQDRYKFKSHEWTYLFWDELTEFTEVQYEYMDTRLRTTDPFLEPYVQNCAGTNPDGEGLLWVRDRFVEPAPPETIVRVETTLRDGRVMAYDQIYIPAKLDDNPLLMASGNYEASLMNKRPEVREAILSGNWYYGMSGTFLQSIWDSRIHVVENHDIPAGARIFRVADWGIGHASSIGYVYEDKDGGFTMFAHLRTQGLTVPKVTQKMKAIEQEYGLWDEEGDCSGLNFQRNPLDTACFGTGQGLIGARTIAKDFATCGFRWIKAKKGPGSRKLGASQIILRLTTMIPAAFEGADDPTERERPMLRFMQRCASPIKRLPTLRTDPDDADDVDKDAGDDDDWDMCVISSTYVDTLRGTAMIQDLVGEEGFVRSFDGQFHAFRNCRKTRSMVPVVTLHISDGTTLTCTPDHRVLCADGTWREAIDCDSIPVWIQPTTRWLSRRKSNSGTESTGGSVEDTSSDTASNSIALSTSGRTDRSRLITTSTTSTKTSPTTLSPISKPSTNPTTAASISGNSWPLEDSSPEECQRRRARRIVGRLPPGTNPPQGSPGMKHTATSYEGPSPRNRRSWQSGEGIAGPPPSSALVTHLTVGQVADVYCLEVPGPAAFVVQRGVVVSNCQYMCLQTPIEMPDPTKETWDDDDVPQATARRGRTGLGEGPWTK